MKYEKILFICSGNQCRSPMAEALLKNMDKKGHWLKSPRTSVTSAGTLDKGQIPATDEAIQVMREKGLDISQHRTRHIDRDIVDTADIILVMGDMHRRYILEHFPDAKHKVHLLTEFVGEAGDVLDPIRCPVETYRQCAEQITSLIDKLLKRPYFSRI